LSKQQDTKKLRIAVVLSVLADGRKLTTYVILKRKNLQKKLPAGTKFKCDEKEWLMEELMVE
jgi:hypothetical protein